MGKKPKNNSKVTTKAVKTQTSDPPSLKISELCLEEFEKSLASVLESLSNKKIEILRKCAYNSNNDPTTVIGKISAKYHLENNETLESLQETILTAANMNPCVNTKVVAVKSTTSSDRTNSSQEDNQNRNVKHLHTVSDSRKKIDAEDEETIFRQNKEALFDIQHKYHKYSITPPRREGLGISELKKCLSDGKLQEFNLDSEENSFFTEQDDSLPRKRGLNKSFSHFRNYGELIEMRPNIYIRANKHFIIDELSLDDILQKIYFEAYSYEDLKDYVFSALRKVASLDEFLDLLYTTIRDYSLRVKEHIMDRLDEVIIKTKRLVKGNNGYPEIVHEFGGYKKFSKHCVAYTDIVDKIYEAYKTLEIISGEVEKICTLYIDGFCKERVRFSCAGFHKRVFAKYFYNDPWIKDFLETISRYFEERHFYASKYPTAVSQILELVACLNRLQQYESDGQQVVESFDEKGYERPNGLEEEEEETSREMDNEKVRVSLTVHEEILKKMIQKDLGETGYDEYETFKGAEKIPIEASKAKKKRNKKKKNKGGEANKDIDAVTPENTSSSSKPIENKNEKENALLNREKKKDLFKGLLKQNTGNLKLDNEVEAFERRLDLEMDQSETSEKIKPNISSEWVQSLRQRLQKQK